MNLILKYLFLALLSLHWVTSRETTCLRDASRSRIRTKPNLSTILNFEIDLFKNLISLKDSSTENFFMSPYSIWHTLVSMYLGASSRTETQLRDALGLKDKRSTLNLLREIEFRYKLRALKDKENNTLSVLNRIYFDKSVELEDCLIGALHSNIYKLSFDQPHKAAKEINGVISKATRGKIQNIVQPDDLVASLMAVINAAYFKGTWEHPFEAERTRVMDFTKFNGDVVPIDMMEQYGDFKIAYKKKLGANVLEFPYVGDKLAMYVFLPDKPGKLPFESMIKNLEKETILGLMSAFKNKRNYSARIRLPKFKIESQIESELEMALTQYGIRDAFDRLNSDFRGFSKTSKLTLSKGIHKAYVDINEKGTEAAAVTIFISTKMGGMDFFDCQRPFVFAIVDKELQNVLFIGSYVSPKASSSQGASVSQDRSTPFQGQVRNNNYPRRSRSQLRRGRLPQK